jgi:hypothetical protein
MAAWDDSQPRDWWRALSGRSRVGGDRGVVASVCLLRPLSAPTELGESLTAAASRVVQGQTGESGEPRRRAGSALFAGSEVSGGYVTRSPRSVGASRRAAA